MLYEEHYRLKEKYREAQKRYDEIVAEQEQLFSITQPQAVKYGKEKVSGGMKTNSFDSYLISKEAKRIDERLSEIKCILAERRELLMEKEYELRRSKSWLDIIYTLYYLDFRSVRLIASRVPYSKTQIWRILKKISQKLKEGTK